MVETPKIGTQANIALLGVAVLTGGAVLGFILCETAIGLSALRHVVGTRPTLPLAALALRGASVGRCAATGEVGLAVFVLREAHIGRAILVEVHTTRARSSGVCVGAASVGVTLGALTRVASLRDRTHDVHRGRVLEAWKTAQTKARGNKAKIHLLTGSGDMVECDQCGSNG